LRQWDTQAARRVDDFIAISELVRARIAKYYGRESSIIYPSIDTGRFAPSDSGAVGDYFLVVSRLVPYKRIDLAIRACNELKVKLKIVGGGRDKQALQRIAGPTVEFLGRVSDEDIRRLYAECKAFIFPGEEDFGLTPIEAQASGRPVIAYGAGGALETVIEGQTGCFFRQPTVESLIDALSGFEPGGWDSPAIRRNAERFDNSVFKSQLAGFVDTALSRPSEGSGIV
jgi:glycosyltransferase involved in cell wall biosynthesis